MARPNEEEGSIDESEAQPPRRSRAERLLRWYYAAKYWPFRRERRTDDGRRGLVVLQIDALAYADLRRALELGHCPTIASLLRKHGFEMRRWFCGLPSATPYCQAGIFHGENEGIPAFRFYDKAARQVITCNAPQGVQYIRDRIRSPGALAGGSSYVNLLDGDAETVAFTVATRERTSVWHRLGGGRMLLLILLHPIRTARMVFQAVWEWLREEYERAIGEFTRRRTHSEGIFPFLRIFTNVVIRELQTIAVVLDIHLGVPVIYTTFMQYDELAHHFGPSSPQALKDLRRTDARIAEIWRMMRSAAGRRYDLVVLSDHGMTPARSYRVRFGESLGSTVQRILRGDARRYGRPTPHSLASFAEDSEYADLGPRLMESMADAARPRHRRLQRTLRKLGQWLRSRYGLREILLPEKYHVDTRQDVVTTYSSCLAHVYFADDVRQLGIEDLGRDPRRAHLYAGLLEHPGNGLLLTRSASGVHVEATTGRALLRDGTLDVIEGENPLEGYGSEPYLLRAIESMVRQPNAGDIVLVGAYDGYDIMSYDDQIGAHGSFGGDQVYPFLVAPASLGLGEARIEDARDLHGTLLLRYARDGGGPPSGSLGSQPRWQRSQIP